MSEIGRLVVLRPREAYLVVHVLGVFERLLRQGDLSVEQLSLLVPGTAITAGDQADVEMAEVVAEAAELLRHQL